MRHTRHKLDEAAFFLKKLHDHYFDHADGFARGEVSTPTFSYYLSAFVSSARSVAWVMRHEYVDVPGWQEWYDAKVPDEDQEALLRIFNQLRVRSEKTEPLIPGHALKFADDPGVPPRDSRMPKLEVTISAVGEPNVRIAGGELAALLWTLDEFDGEDILRPCQRYFELLSLMVDECESKFGISASYNVTC